MSSASDADKPTRVPPDFFVRGGVFLQPDSDGTIWRFKQGSLPGSSRLSLPDFVAEIDSLVPGNLVRISGDPSSSPLVCALAPRVSAGCLRVEIGSPRLAHTPAIQLGTSQVLLRLRERPEGLAASLGGWHALSDTTLPTYQLAVALASEVPAPDWESVFHKHPTWPSLSFLGTLDKLSAARTVVAIMDPRWFVDVAHPNRASRLFLYLGLTPDAFRATKASGRKTLRAVIARRAWVGDGAPADASSPSQFLWRWHGGCESGADYRTTRWFIDYLRQTWLSALYQARVPGSEPLFDPHIHFDNVSVAEAYRSAVTT
jgi:hypothetical protein